MIFGKRIYNGANIQSAWLLELERIQGFIEEIKIRLKATQNKKINTEELQDMKRKPATEVSEEKGRDIKIRTQSIGETKKLYNKEECAYKKEDYIRQPRNDREY